MEMLLDVASYVYNRYRKEFREEIDEMKLHKLLYFAQRESLIQTGKPLFTEDFYGWKYGPILKEVRAIYRNRQFESEIQAAIIERITPVMDKVFAEYASKSSWSLSRLTHGEESWKNSRINVQESENSDNKILLDDIKKDAERIRTRRKQLAELGI